MTFSPNEIRSLRAETTGTQYVTHLNNAGAALMPDPVRDAVFEYLHCESHIGGYETVRKYEQAHQDVYASLARLINAESSEEIALVESATIGWYKAFGSFRFQPGDIILTAQAEYGSNYIGFLQAQKYFGVEILPVPNDAHGQVSVGQLEAMITDKVKLIAITHIPSNGGLVNPASEVGKIARKHHIPFLLDACQSIGQFPIDVQEIGCDMLSGTGRKFLRGPRGTGFLYVRKELIADMDPLFPDIHSAEWSASDTYIPLPNAIRFENFEHNFAGLIGLGKAADYAFDLGMDRIWERVSSLAALLRKKLKHIPGIMVHDLGKEKGGIVTFSHLQMTPGHIQAGLGAEGINVSKTAVGYTRLDMEARNIKEMVRASVHYYNTEDEVEKLCHVLEKML